MRYRVPEPSEGSDTEMYQDPNALHEVNVNSAGLSTSGQEPPSNPHHQHPNAINGNNIPNPHHQHHHVINGNNSYQQFPSQLLTPTHLGDLMGTPRIFGSKNPEMSPKTFLKAIKRCWSLNPSFFVNDTIKVAFTATRLSGSAELWFSVLEDRDDDCLDSWSAFEARFLIEFSTTRTEWQTRVDLVYLRQKNNPIAEYTSQFRSLANQLNFGDEALLSLFFLGLNPQIQQYIESLHSMPSTFNDIVATALDYGSRSLIRRSNHAPPSQSFKSTRLPPPPVGDSSRPMEIATISPDNVNFSVPGLSRQQRSPLTIEEKTFRVQNNLCLYCSSANHLVDLCPLKPSKN